MSGGFNDTKSFNSDRYDFGDMRSNLPGGLSAASRSTHSLAEQRIDSPRVDRNIVDLIDTSLNALQRHETRSAPPTDKVFNNPMFSGEALLHKRMNELRINTNVVNGGGLNSSALTASTISPTTPLSAYTPFRTGADQNPPCNTLYVGNLPINSSEQELLQLFSHSLGFKRLLFRNRPAHGPMCFVEFGDVHCATLALHELSGTPLSNSTKGGIRLSYSKNPLGVRQQQSANLVSSQPTHLLSPSSHLMPHLLLNLKC
jgi:hypothetical protein